MSGRVAGKAAVVIGAARGIGAAIAARLVAEEAKVAIADTLESEGTATAERLGRSCFFQATDVARKESVEALMAVAMARFGRVDILVQNE